MDLNKVMLIGRLTRDPETRTTPQAQQVTTFSVATSFSWKDQTGNRQVKTEFHNVVAWRKLAEITAQYLKKASKIYVEGRLQTRSWDDPQGVKKYRTEIIMDNMIMLDSKGASGGGAMGSNPFPSSGAGNQPPAIPPAPPADDEIRVEDIPF
ncbi:MAG: single-stranded DNA-binding protein [Parcubacteria group bacterium]|nr:single-stranded DNA-binding protein [Parcubacteria group bacterium]